LAKVPEGVSIDETLMAGSANITRFASSIAILDKSARGSDYRFLKILKERKNGVPAEVIELEYTEKEYKHYNFFGTISEDEVLYTKTNRKRFGQAVVEEDPEEEESQNPRPRSNKRGIDWTDEDTERLKALIESGEELDYEAIAKEFGCSSKTIERRVKKLKEEGSEE
jgi:transcriptional antiterminator